MKRQAVRALASLTSCPRLHAVADRIAAEPVPVAAAQSALEFAAAQSTREMVQWELAALPDEQRAALRLICIEKLSYAEAAARLGMSTDAMRGHLSRGRIALATKFVSMRHAPRSYARADWPDPPAWN